MRISAKRTAVCSMLAALTVVLMLLGSIGELGMYACPMIAGLCYIPIGEQYGRKYQWTLFAAAGLLSLLLVPSVEENLMFLGFFGWYPAVRPFLQRLGALWRWVLKLILFNAAVIAVEWLVMTVLAPEAMETPLLWALLILGNLTFVAYDFMIPRLEILLARVFPRL